MNNELKNNKIIEPQLQVKICENKLNEIQALRYPYMTKFGKITKKEFLAKLLSVGFDCINESLKEKL